MNICLLSGLPRSGSTVLRAILEQNSSLNVSPYSGLKELLENTTNGWNTLPHSAYPRNDSLKRVLKAITFNYHTNDKGIHIDLDRSWPSYIRQFEDITETRAKIVCMVRPIYQVIASIEKLKQKNPHESFKETSPSFTMQDRVTSYMAGFVGVSYRAMIDALDSNVGDRILFVDYNKFISSPQIEMNRIYNHWNLSKYQHSFDYLHLQKTENDDFHGVSGLHEIKSKLIASEYRPEDIIGSRITTQLNENYPSFWEPWT